MKIRPEHVKALEAGIALAYEGNTPDHRAAYFAALAVDPRVKDRAMRFRWDVLYAIPWHVRAPLMKAIYEYANDSHIETALKRLIPLPA